MHERVSLLGGNLEVRSHVGVGTSVTAQVPLPEPEGEEDVERADGHSSATLLIADDHDLSRSGLRSMLEDEKDLEVIGEASNGKEALELCRQLRPDVVLMDVRMPEMNGLQAARAIKREYPSTSVVMVTMHEDPGYLYEALKCGAAGYVLKNAAQDELIRAVRKVLGGESPLNSDVSARLLRRLVSEDAERKESNGE